MARVRCTRGPARDRYPPARVADRRLGVSRERTPGAQRRRQTHREDAREHPRIALEHLCGATVHLILIGGPPGTGKSTVSERLAERTGVAMVSSDRVRKELAGLPAHGTAPDLYTEEHTDRTYTCLVEQAEHLLRMGKSVVLDASWNKEGHRKWAENLAKRTACELVSLRCTAPDGVVTERPRRRTDTASDADADVARALAARPDPWSDAIELDTSVSTETAVDTAVGYLR